MGQSCIDGAVRLFTPSLEEPDVLESLGEDEFRETQLEPIDVLVDIIIGCLEKGTAFMRVVGNRSFSMLSGVVKDSTVDLVLSVSVSARGFSSVVDIANSNLNVGTLRNFLLTRTRKGMRVTTGIRKTAMTMTTRPPLWLRTAKVKRQKIRCSRTTSRRFSKQKSSTTMLRRLMRDLRATLVMIR